MSDWRTEYSAQQIDYKYRVVGEAISFDDDPKLFVEHAASMGERYEQLLGALANLGTEVERTRILEDDPMIPPLTLVEKAFHTFVFPPQPSAVLRNQDGKFNGVIPDCQNPYPYSRTGESQAADYDESLVQGMVHIFSANAGIPPFLYVSDEFPGGKASSGLPEEVSAAINEATKPL